jgi:hypothetical protein
VKSGKAQTERQLRATVEKTYSDIEDVTSKIARGHKRLNKPKAEARLAVLQARLQKALDHGRVVYHKDLKRVHQTPVPKRKAPPKPKVFEEGFSPVADTAAAQRHGEFGVLKGQGAPERAIGGKAALKRAEVQTGTIKETGSSTVSVRSGEKDIGIRVVETPDFVHIGGTHLEPIQRIDPLHRPDHQLDLRDPTGSGDLSYKDVWGEEPGGSVVNSTEEALVNKVTRGESDWNAAEMAYEGRLTVETIRFMPDSPTKDSDAAKVLIELLLDDRPEIRRMAYIRLRNMADQEWGQNSLLQPDKIPMDHERWLAGIVDNVSNARAAVETANVRHLIAEGRKIIGTLKKHKFKGQEGYQAPKTIAPYRGALDIDDHATKAIIEGLPEDLKPYIEMDAAGDFYKPFQPWDADQNALDLPLNGPESDLHKLLDRLIESESRVAIMEGGDNIVQVLRKAEAFAARVQSVTPRNAIQAFKIRNQAGYDLFHGLMDDMFSGAGNWGMDDMLHIHDEVFEAVVDAQKGVLNDSVSNDVLINWLLMESRAGLAHALPADVINKIAQDLMVKNGVLGHEGLRMFNPTYSARNVSRHLRVDPSIHGLFKGSRPKAGGTWWAEPNPNWVKAERPTRFWERSMFDQFNRYSAMAADKFPGELPHITRYVSSYVTAVTAVMGTWVGTPARKSLMQHGIRNFGGRSISKGKILSKTAQQEVYDVYLLYIKELGGLPEFFNLEKGGLSIKNEVTGEVLLLARKGARGVSKKKTLEMVNYREFRLGLSEGNASKDLGFEVLTAYEKAMRFGLVKTDNPFEATMHFIADRQWWGGGSYSKSTRYLETMDGFGMGSEAREVVSNLYEGGLRNFRQELVAAADDGGATLDNLIDSERGVLFQRLSGEDATTFKSKAIAEQRTVSAADLSEQQAEKIAEQEVKNFEDAALLDVHEAARDDTYLKSFDDVELEAQALIDDVEVQDIIATIRDKNGPGVRLKVLRKELKGAKKDLNQALTDAARLDPKPAIGPRPPRAEAVLEDLRLAQAKHTEIRRAVSKIEGEQGILDTHRSAVNRVVNNVADSLTSPRTTAEDFEALRSLARKMMESDTFSFEAHVAALTRSLKGIPSPRQTHLGDLGKLDAAVSVPDAKLKVTRGFKGKKTKVEIVPDPDNPRTAEQIAFREDTIKGLKGGRTSKGDGLADVESPPVPDHTPARGIGEEGPAAGTVAERQVAEGTGRRGEVGTPGIPKRGGPETVHGPHIVERAPGNVGAKPEQLTLFNEVGLSGPAPETVSHVRAAVAASDAGLDEEEWLARLHKQNRDIINNSATSKAARAEAKQSNRNIARAVRNIRIEKFNGVYKAPATHWNAAQKASRGVAEQVAGVIPPKLIAYFAKTVEGMNTEMARSVHAMLKGHNIVDGGLPGMRKYKPEHWESITDEVGEAVRKVQAKRKSPLGLRTVKDEALEQTDEVDKLLRTRRDHRPRVIKAKKDALDAAQKRLGIPPAERIGVDEYDRIRTLLQPHIGRKNRGVGLLRDARLAGGDYRDNFLKARLAKADQNATDNVAWTMLENPGMEVDDAVEHLKASWYNDGTIRYDPVEISREDASVLRRFFEHTTGTNMDNEEEVVKALAANGTLPPMGNKHRFRLHMEDNGTWSPRALETVKAKGTWSIEENTKWWMDNYGQAPRWLTDDRITTGKALQGSRANYLSIMRETGNFDETARLTRELGPNQNIDIKDLAHGNPDKGLSPAKSVAEERQYMIQFYGKLVSDDNITLKAAPWLMTYDEITAYAAKNAVDGVIPGVIKNIADIKAVQEAVKRATAKYVDAHLGLANATGTVTIDPETVQLMAFTIVRELATTTPWRGALAGARAGGKLGLARRALGAWQWLWTTSVVSNPGFTMLNSTDIPLRAGWFGATDSLARAGHRVSEATKLRIPHEGALGLGESTAFSNGFPTRPFHERILHGFSAMDRAAGVIDMFTNAVPRAILPRIENTVKHRLGMQLYEGMMQNAEIMHKLRVVEQLTEDEIDVLLKIQVKGQLNRWFPTLQNAGPAEKLLNAVMPFTSYYAKNQIIWIGEMLDHPWALNAINRWNEALTEHNMREWEEMHPDDRMLPEHLRNQIRLPWEDDDGAPVYLDIGVFIDATRGMQALTNSNKNADVGALFSNVFRPLPSQVAFFKSLGYDTLGAFGRKKFVKTYDENGLVVLDENGNFVYDEITVPPGTPWGDDGFDFFRDIVWAVDFYQQLQDTDHDFGNRILTTANMLTFSALARPSQYFMLNQQYFALKREDDANDTDYARQWLTRTHDGKRLNKMWSESAMTPTDLTLNPFALSYGEDDPIPDSDDIQARWLRQQSPEAKQELFDTWNEAEMMRDMWDDRMDRIDADDSAALRTMWVERETFFHAYYAEHPNVAYYWGMGMDQDELLEWRAEYIADRERDDFFKLFGWDGAPDFGTPERKKWEEERESYLRAHPAIVQMLADSKTDYDRLVDKVQKSWDVAAKGLREVGLMRDAAFAADNLKGVKAANALADGFSMAFNAEAFGNDALPGQPSKFRLRPDSLGLAVRKARGDPDAIREAHYGQRMAAVIKKVEKKDGTIDPFEFHRVLDRNPDLLEQYLLKNPKKRATWQVNGQYLKMWDRFGRLADKGLWDQAWATYDNAPQRVKDYMADKFPKKFKKWEMDSRYNTAMGVWVGMFDTKGAKAAMAYFNGLPGWMKERYYSNHKGTTMNSGQGTQYVSMLNQMFDLIDGGNWDAAERVWQSAPSWMRRRYYANNPSSTLFRGGKGSSGSGYTSYGSGGGISDAKYKQYSRLMKKWVDLYKDGKDKQAEKYFASLPEWAKDFYIRQHPDKALLKESLAMQTLVADYMLANKAHQRQMLIDSPQLARWLNDNDAKSAWANAVQFAYGKITDPWQQRVFREKYPEIFSKEAIGKAKIDAVMATLGENPALVQPWLRWYKHIAKTLAEAMKYMKSRPKPLKVEHDYERRGNHRGMSAEEVSERVDKYINRAPALNKRMPKLEG